MPPTEPTAGRPARPLTVLGRATSVNVQAVLWTLDELRLPWERQDYGHVHGGTDTAAFRSLNPNGLVPVLRDGDLALFESAAIVRYLAARYGDAVFWPADPAVRAPLDMWAEWVKTSLAPATIQGVFYPLVRAPLSQVDPVVVQAGVERLMPLAAMLDARLGDGPWLAGEAFTWADILTGYLLHRFFDMEIPRPELPRLAAYFARLRDRPAYARHVVVPYDMLRAPEPDHAG